MKNSNCLLGPSENYKEEPNLGLNCSLRPCRRIISLAKKLREPKFKKFGDFMIYYMGCVAGLIITPIFLTLFFIVYVCACGMQIFESLRYGKEVR